MDEIKEYGQVKLDHNNNHKNIFLLSIIGEIEGHENVASGTKATKYEHILPMLAKIEDDQDLKNVPPWHKVVVVQNKNSITNIYHTQMLALLLKVCYNIKVTLNFNGYNTRGYCRKN